MRLRDIPTGARIELLGPYPQRPSRQYLLQLATTNTQSFFNEIQATGRAWAIGDQPIVLTVASGQSEYLLPVGNEWGRPIDVYTTDPSNSSFIERQIEFTELGDRLMDWEAPRNSQGYLDSAGHTAQRMMFYKKAFSNDQYVSVWPVPTGSSSYKICYSVGEWATQMSLDDSPLLTQHHALIVVKTAMDALPGTSWFDHSEEQENRLRRNELRASFESRLPILMDQWKRHIKNVTQPRMTWRNLYAIE